MSDGKKGWERRWFDEALEAIRRLEWKDLTMLNMMVAAEIMKRSAGTEEERTGGKG